MKTGLFITFEGSEACGKTTQIVRLAARLTARGREPLLTREPGGTEAGEVIRDLLQHSKSGRNLTAEAELLLFAASRAQLAREVIAPALTAGRVVLADRFLDSTTVYQGAARRLDAALVERVNRFAAGDCLPDVTFLFDLSLEAAQERMAGRERAADRMESQPVEFFEAVRRGYLELAARESGRFVVLDAGASVEAIEEEIWSVLEGRFVV